jgi:regulatory protein
MRGRPVPPGTARGSVHEAALRLLARRAYSAGELKQRLETKGFGAGAVRAEIARLTEVGFLNDAQLADAVVRSQLARGRGRRAASVELRRRGVPRAESDAALDAMETVDEARALDLAVDAATARHPRWFELLQARRKVIRYLLARGFDPGQVRDTLAERSESDHGEHDADNPRDP